MPHRNIIQTIFSAILLFSGSFFISSFPQPLDFPKALTAALFAMFAGYLLLTPLFLKNQSKQLFWGLALLSLVLQLQWLLMPAFFNDFFRYLWDGTMSINGINPFQYFPFAVAESPDPSLSAFGSVWYWGLMYFKWTHTIYGPTAQLVFALGAWIKEGSSLALKFLFFLCNLGSFALGVQLLEQLKKPRNSIFLLFLHPLFLFETMATAHIESLYIFCLFLTLYLFTKHKQALTGIALALVTLTKFFPLLFWPLFILHKKNPLKGIWDRKTLVVSTIIAVALLYLPFFFRLDSPALLFESFQAFSANWVMSPGIFALVQEFFSYKTTKLLLNITTIALTLFSYYRYSKHQNIFQAVYEITLWLIIFSSVVFSWYVLWLLALVPFIKNKWPAIILSGTVLCQYALITFDNIEHFTYKYIHDGQILSYQLFIWIPFFVALLLKKRQNSLCIPKLSFTTLVNPNNSHKENRDLVQ